MCCKQCVTSVAADLKVLFTSRTFLPRAILSALTLSGLTDECRDRRRLLSIGGGLG